MALQQGRQSFWLWEFWNSEFISYHALHGLKFDNIIRTVIHISVRSRANWFPVVTRDWLTLIFGRNQPVLQDIARVIILRQAFYVPVYV
jgi:hypothetical protein